MGGEASAHAEFGWGMFKVSADFKANYSSKKDSKATAESKYSVEYTMDVKVHAGQDSMPAGLATVLGILQSSITSGTPGGRLAATVTALALNPASTTGGQQGSVGASYYDDNNLLVKAGDPNVPTFTFTLSDPNLSFDAASVHGAVSGTPTATAINITPASDGIASVNVKAATAFVGPTTVALTVSGNTALSATVNVTKAA
jgi:hypothetical protein